MRVKKSIILIFFLFVIFMYVCNIDNIPSRVILMDNEKMRINTLFGVNIVPKNRNVIETWKSGEVETESMEVNLLGVVPVKEISVTTLPRLSVVPLGNIVGLKLYTNGVLVVGMSEVESESNEFVKPYENSEIKEGDMIFEINDHEIDSIETLKSVVNSSQGDDLIIKYFRDGSVLTSTIKPVKGTEDDYKIGLWVRDSATGVGTISFYVPESGKFAALGHGIIDVDTGELIDIEVGDLVTSNIISVEKAKVGNPGEIKGSISNGVNLGVVENNTNFGLYGSLNNLSSLGIINNCIDIANRDEIVEGDAYILCDIDGNGVMEYSVDVTEIYLNNNYDNKSFQIKVNDSELIEKTGGIICGMSGSPIIQNNKLIGVVTNVLVSNPEVGYGVFGDLMVKEMMK